MTTALVAPVPRQMAFKVGIAAPGAKFYFFEAGSATPATTWNHADLATIHENTNPVVADANGLFGPIYLAFGVQYDVILKDANDVIIYSQPNVGNTGIDATAQYNVVDYGAIGNGSTNDAAAFQAALDAIKASGEPGTLYIPNGTYRILGALTYHDGPPLRVLGQSKPGAVLVWDDTASRGFDIDCTVSQVQTNLTVNGALGDRTVTVANGALANVGDWAFLDDSQTNGGTLVTKVKSIAGNDLTLEDALPCPLLIASAANVKLLPAGAMLEGIEFRDVSLTCVSTAPTNKLTLLLLSRCDSPLVENCVFDGSTGPLITTRQTYNGNILRSTFLHAVTVAGSGIENQSATGLLVQGNDISMCQFGCTFASSPYCRFEGNRVNGRNTSVALGRGVRYGVSSNFGVIIGNNISDCNLYGIYNQDSAYLAIQANTISFCGVDPAEHGIQVGGFETNFCHHCSIVGNIISKCSGYGITVAPTSTTGDDISCTIVGNNISGCVQGAIQLFRVGKCTVTGNFLSGAGATVVNGLLDVRSTGCGRHSIVGNQFALEDGVACSAIITNATGGTGTGQNRIAQNILGPGLKVTMSASDYFPLGQAQKISEVATGANTTKTTAWTIPIIGGTFVSPGQQFEGEAIFTFANNGNTKNLEIAVGTAAIPFGSTDANVQVTMRWRAVVQTSASIKFWCDFYTSSGLAAGGTFATSTDDWTADQNIVISMQNGTASAADITFRMGAMTWQG